MGELGAVGRGRRLCLRDTACNILGYRGLGFRASYRDYCQLSLNGHIDLGNSLPLSL